MRFPASKTTVEAVSHSLRQRLTPGEVGLVLEPTRQLAKAAAQSPISQIASPPSTRGPRPMTSTAYSMMSQGGPPMQQGGQPRHPRNATPRAQRMQQPPQMMQTQQMNGGSMRPGMPQQYGGQMAPQQRMPMNMQGMPTGHYMEQPQQQYPPQQMMAPNGAPMMAPNGQPMMRAPMPAYDMSPGYAQQQQQPRMMQPPQQYGGPQQMMQPNNGGIYF